MSITVYGSSDDLIEVEGDIREEFSAVDAEPNYLAFSNGVVLRIVYDDDGMWRISPLAGASRVTITFGDDPEENYSDRAHLHETAGWVVHGKSWARWGEGEAQ